MNTVQHTAGSGDLVPKGKLLIIGGAEDKGEKDAPQPSGVKMEVLQCFMELLPVKKGSVEVITTAGSEDPAGTFCKY